MSKSRHTIEVKRLEYADGDDTGFHSHERHQLSYARTGVLTVAVDTSRWVVPPLRAVWIPAGVSHSLRAHGPTDVRPVYIGPGQIPLHLEEVAVVSVRPLLRALIEELDSDEPQGEEERHHLESLFVLQLERLASRPLQLPTLQDPRLALIQDGLTQSPGDRRTLQQWGQHCGASERTLIRLFASDAGTTFGNWRTQLRLQHALIHLAQGWSVTATAYECGYRSPSAFIEGFRTVLGTTPGRFFDVGP
jgi:AraC-like DNA-binding protein/mannose-6-phosphate isomerase-like protein (cupin superfamily)